MQQLIRITAFAAAALCAFPILASDQPAAQVPLTQQADETPQLPLVEAAPVSDAVPAIEPDPTVAPPVGTSVPVAVSAPAPATQSVPGQARADYLAWLARDPGARAQILAFKQFLAMENVEDVVPTWQLVRTASMWRECSGPRFEVAPAAEWQHLAGTLKFVKNHVQPIVGKVEAVSGYRGEQLNQCSGGAKASAHRHYYALDLIPASQVSREGLIRSICKIHDLRGRDYEVGLGFYAGTRFHVDSKGYRRWGANGKGATSPCGSIA